MAGVACGSIEARALAFSAMWWLGGHGEWERRDKSTDAHCSCAPIEDFGVNRQNGVLHEVPLEARRAGAIGLAPRCVPAGGTGPDRITPNDVGAAVRLDGEAGVPLATRCSARAATRMSASCPSTV